MNARTHLSHRHRSGDPQAANPEVVQCLSSPPKPSAPEVFDNEMADFDADMERDEALDLHRDQQLIKAWLAPQKGRQQQ